ncbi:MAG: ABC transporter substrate-binding protein [Saprospiraceae bacterium]|jgi:peptide/nickel transport system substrate-binding protein
MKSTLYILTIGLLVFYGCQSIESNKSFNRNPKELIIRLEAEPDQLNPLLKTNAYAAQVLDGLFSYLLTIDHNTFELLPYAVKSLPQITPIEEGPWKGGLTYTFEILEEASWDDGKPITGNDYVFSLKTALHPEIPAQHIRPYLTFIKDVQVDSINPKKFTVYTGEPYILGLAAIGNSIQLLPAHHYDPEGWLSNIPFTLFTEETQLEKELSTNKNLRQFATYFTEEKFSRNPESIQGSGPYQLVSWETGQQIVLERKKEWWGDRAKDKNPVLRALPEKIIYKPIINTGTAIAALKSEEIDVLTKIDPANFQDLLNDPTLNQKFHFETPLSLVYYFIALNTQDGLLSDRNVRQAIAYAIDIDEIIEKLYNGNAQRTISPVLPSASYYNSNIEPYPFNPNQSEELLKRGGWSDSDGDGYYDKIIQGKKEKLEVRLAIPANSENARNLGILVQDNAKLAGISIVLEPKEGAVLLADWRNKNYQMTLSGSTISPDFWDPKQRLHSEGDNRTGFGNQYTDDLIDAIRVTLDEKIRTEKYMELQNILHEEVAHIYLFVPTERLAIHKRYEPITTPLAPGFVSHFLKLRE